MKVLVLSVCLTLLTCATAAQAGWRSNVRSGDKLYEQGKYDDALVKYLEALNAQGDSTLINFDLGNVYQSQEKFQDAGQAFMNTMGVSDSLNRADALYNLGNALVGGQKYQEAVEAYRSALKLNPDQPDYLHNLELAMHLAKNPPQQQQNPGGQSDQKQKDQQDQDSQQKQDQQHQKSDQKQPQQQQDQSAQEQQQQQPPDQEQQKEQQPMQAQALSKEDAERLLNALQTDEKQVQETLHRQKATEAGVEKDW